MTLIMLENNACVEGDSVVYFWFETLTINLYFHDTTSVAMVYTDSGIMALDKATLLAFIAGDPNGYINISEVYIHSPNINVVELTSVDLYTAYLGTRDFTYNTSTNILTVL